ncbi:hypothetical protein K458DRAFT_387542 [Lentithecium fluviatile CBS 122367]|uniref:Uncharacterized protein n=1 Tax=Lentithecium fluviatile CBS 122367 TaxID=1168545 RepID=A0A6G1J5W7_9PLEO|nr:hypothetical protein K458DRAFT_387542 [Lentithecium fluviatile CBS 122367]
MTPQILNQKTRPPFLTRSIKFFSRHDKSLEATEAHTGMYPSLYTHQPSETIHVLLFEDGCRECWPWNIAIVRSISWQIENEKHKCCDYCHMSFGRPFCSWGPDIPAPSISNEGKPGNDFPELEAQGDTANILRRKALVSLPAWTHIDTKTADPKWMALDTGDGEGKNEQLPK